MPHMREPIGLWYNCSTSGETNGDDISEGPVRPVLYITRKITSSKSKMDVALSTAKPRSSPMKSQRVQARHRGKKLRCTQEVQTERTDFGQAGSGVCHGPSGAQTQKNRAPKGVAPKGGGPEISRFFPVSHHQFRSCLLVVFWWCLEAPTPSNVHVWSSRVVVKPRRPRSRRGFTPQPGSVMGTSCGCGKHCARSRRRAGATWKWKWKLMEAVSAQNYGLIIVAFTPECSW